MVEMVSSLQETVQSKASVAVETIFKCTAVICTKMRSDSNNDLGSNNTIIPQILRRCAWASLIGAN